MALNDECQKQEVLKGNLFYQNSKPTLKSIFSLKKLDLQPTMSTQFQMLLSKSGLKKVQSCQTKNNE